MLNTHLHPDACTNTVAHIHFHHPSIQWTATNGVFSRCPFPFRTPPPLPPPPSQFFSLSPPSWRLPGSRERLHTHIHPTMPLRVFRMSLFTSWSVQVAGKQTQSLSGNFFTILTSTHLLPCCTITSFLNFKAESESRLESISVHKLFCLSPVASNSFNISCGWCCWVLPTSLFSLSVCQTDRLVWSAPPSNFDVIIDSSHLAPNSKVRRAAPHFWIALTFTLHMLSGFTDPRAKQKQRSLALGCVTARQRCASFLFFFFFFYSPTEDDVYVIDFFSLLLSPPTFRCVALSRTESRLDQCIVFLSQSHSNESKTRKVM